MLRVFTAIWLFVLAALGFEYFLLNKFPMHSFTYWLQVHHVVAPTFAASPAPGRPLSLLLGWLGIGFMLLTNLYILRKRVPFMRRWGRVPGWLDFHIFCGLIGPTFILFHCNFKVGGLVAISFWSMMISFSSGIIGRYLYLNIVSQKQDSVETADHYWARFIKYVDRYKIDKASAAVSEIKMRALHYVGVPGLELATDASISARPSPSIAFVFFGSLLGDLRMFFGPPPTLPGLPDKTRYMLQEYAVNKRHTEFLQPFQRIMGYWHTFHSPFAIFMYVVAAIHIVAALLLGVTA